MKIFGGVTVKTVEKGKSGKGKVNGKRPSGGIGGRGAGAGSVLVFRY